jgi:multidrug efflux pump subunit AcrB
MKFIQNSLICVLLVSLALMTGCTKPPTEEMNRAEEAVARAENDLDAVNYAANLVERAKDALALMHEEADAKRYDAAINYANDAVSLAERAINEGRAEAGRTREQAINTLSGLRPQLLETEKRIDNAKAAKLRLDYDSIDRDLNTAQRGYDQAQAAVSGNRYQEAIFLSNNVRSNLNGINQKLGATAMAVSRKK